MKNKKTLYFLIPAVLFIWGFIIYRIVDFTSEGDLAFTPRTYTTAFRDSEEVEQYRLKPGYPDPFLKNTEGSDVELLTEEPPPFVTERAEEQPSPLDIQYRGFIKESGTNTRIALMVIQGEEVFMKKSERYNDFVIGTIRADSIAISMSESVRWVRKE